MSESLRSLERDGVSLSAREMGRGWLESLRRVDPEPPAGERDEPTWAELRECEARWT